MPQSSGAPSSTDTATPIAASASNGRECHQRTGVRVCGGAAAASGAWHEPDGRRFNAATMTAATTKCVVTLASGGRERGADEPAGHCAHAPHRVQPVHDRSLAACVDADRHDVHRDVLHAIGDPREHLGGDEPADCRRHRPQGKERGDRDPAPTVVRPGPTRPMSTGAHRVPTMPPNASADERDAEAADAGAELRRELGSGREPHGRGDAVDEERGADATHHHRVRAGPRRLRP